MVLKFSLFTLLILIGFSAAAQDTLPKFSIVNRGKDRIIISWTNPFGAKIRQLSIQRSFDSLRNFSTILTLPDPTVPQNGFVDTKAINDHMFYRLYILMDSGKYSFSKSRRPVIDNSMPVIVKQPETGAKGVIPIENITNDEVKIERIIFVKKRDTLIGGIPESNLKRFRDSINFTTKDTIYYKSTDTIVIKNFIPKEFYRPSRYIFTEKDGNIRIALPEARRRKYSIKFFEEDLSEAFEIKQITETLLRLDKTNFMHSGWFNFELYEDGKLKEKHKLYIPKDF